MPPTPTKSRKSKSFFEQDKYTAELTSGQLVIGVTILLVFGLVCFMLGVIVGKFQPTSPQVASQPTQEQAAAPLQQTPPPAEVQATPPPAEREPERIATGPVAVSPAPDTAAQQPPARPMPPVVNEPRIVPFPESSERQPAATPTVEEAPPVEIQAPAQAAPEPEEEPADDPPASADEAIQVAEAETITMTPVEPSPPATTVQPPAVAPRETPAQASSGRPLFAVQVAALSNRARAEELQRQIQQNTDYEVSLVPSQNGTLVMVQVGRYADRATAGRVRTEMRERHGYRDSFITPIQ